MVEEAIFISNEEAVIIKKTVSKILYKNRIDQLKISKILDISQPMVSNYLYSKEKISKNISELAQNISKKIIDGKNIKFQTCISFGEKNIRGKYFIAKHSEIISNEKNRVIDNLTEAYLLLKGKDLANLIPKVKINIVMGIESAAKPDDIAAFTNGLVIIDNKVISNNGIRFGESQHLSSLLLKLKKNYNVNSIMNIAYFDDIKNQNFKIAHLTKNYDIETNKNCIDILLHKGDFGIEPCAYILGRDAIEVSKKLIFIVDCLNYEK
jgi:predicted fused transcriptional regulator/phosphomethylpyrimidine kinase